MKIMLEDGTVGAHYLDEFTTKDGESRDREVVKMEYVGGYLKLAEPYKGDRADFIELVESLAGKVVTCELRSAFGNLELVPGTMLTGDRAAVPVGGKSA